MSGPSVSETYAKLIDEDGLYDNFRPELKASAPELRLSAGGSGPPSGSGWSPGLSPGLRSGPGLYRASTVALAALCVILLICVIAVSTHKQKTQTSGGEMFPQTDAQKQGPNVTELLSTISRLQQENEELRQKLNASEASRSSLAPPLSCPTDWLSFGGSCYLISSQRRSWSGAQSVCSSKGGHLAIILSAEEQTFLWDLLPRAHWNCWWFGITDSDTEDEWKWVDGTPLVGGFWEEGEPNNHINEDCGYIVKTEVLSRVAIRSWYDAPCSMSLPFICEKEMS